MFNLLASLLVCTTAAFSGGAVRSLPRGEEHPEVIEKFYRSPQGEVHFTMKAQTHSGFLLRPSGDLLSFDEIRGPAACVDWMASTKIEDLPAGCEFVFIDPYDGRSRSVRSESMAELTVGVKHVAL